MLTLPRLLLELDETASNPQNLIELEEHETTLEPERLIRLRFGAFFRKDFALVAVGSEDQDLPLTYGTHYRFVEFYPRTTQACGNEVWGAVLVTDNTLPNKIRATYRAYGGPTQGDFLAFAQAVKDTPKAGSIVAYRDILMRPRGMPPKHHLHDALDLFGLEYVRDSVRELAQAIHDTPNTQRAKVLQYHALQRFNSQIDVGDFEATLRAHIRDHTNPHEHGPAVIELDQVENRAFHETYDENGRPVEGYASPSKTRYVFSHAISRDWRKHIALKGNVHNDTAESIGLSNLINAPVHTGYGDQGAEGGSYELTYNNPQRQVYVGPYSITSFVREHTARYRANTANSTVGEFITGTETSMQQIAQLMIQFNLGYLSLTPKLQDISSSRATVDARLGQFNPEYDEYARLNWNAAYAAFLQELVLHRADTRWNTQDTEIEIPSLMPGLTAWLDFSDARQVVVEVKSDPDAARKLLAIEDKAQPGRVFAQANPAAQPEWRWSQDHASPTAPGLTRRKVLAFTAGQQHLSLRQGTPVLIPANATVLVLARMGEHGTTLWPLMKSPTNPALSATDGLSMHGEQHRAAVLSSLDGTTLITAAPETSQVNKAAAVVLSLQSPRVAHCWIGSRVSLDQGVYPRHLDGSVALAASGLALDQIGINKSSLAQAGEIAEILVYNRQLSLREVKAITHYWQRKHGGDAGFAVSLDFVQSAFEAPQSLI